MFADYIFKYIRDAYDILPNKDRDRLSNIWRGWEQVTGDLYTQAIEHEFNITTKRLLAFNNQRWNSFIFNTSTQITRPTVFTSPADLTGGVNLGTRYLINLSIDGNPPVESDIRGVDPLRTTSSEIAEILNTDHGFALASVNEVGQVVLTSSLSGPGSSIEFLVPSNDALSAFELVFGVGVAELPILFPTYPYVYNLGNKFIQRIPNLRDHIIDDKVDISLSEITDYVVEIGTGVITFIDEPPVKLWAKNTLINQEIPYNNFGYLMDFYDVNSEQYLETLKGLWYAFWVGPKPLNIQRALYLLFGLDTARISGTVKSVSPTIITFREDAGDGTFEGGDLITIVVPSGLVPVVTEGQRLQQFDFFYDGIFVVDQVNTPGFVIDEVGRTGIQDFLTDSASRGISPDSDESKALRTVERNLYLAQVFSDAFINPDVNLANVRSFLTAISPKHKTFLFQIIVEVEDTITITDGLGLDVDFDVTPNVDYNPWLEADDTVLDAGEAGAGEELALDSEVFGHAEESSIEVYHDASTTPVLVDSFEF